MTTSLDRWSTHQNDMHTQRRQIMREEGLADLPIIIWNGTVRLPCVPADKIMTSVPPPANDDHVVKCNCAKLHYTPAWHCPVHGDVVVPMD